MTFPTPSPTIPASPTTSDTHYEWVDNGCGLELHQICNVEPWHVHGYPDDWYFGGPSGTDPRADARFRPNVYVYLDRTLHVVHTTSVHVCDDQAIDYFTDVAGWGVHPVYLQVRRVGSSQLEMIPWVYDETTDEVTPFK